MNGTIQPQNQPVMPVKGTSVWFWMVVAVAALAVLLGALYYINYSAPEEGDNTAGVISPADSEVAALERGLNAESFDDLGSELEDIEKVLAE